MQSFKDTEGRIWELSVNVASVMRVKGICDVDLTNLADGKTIARLQDEPIIVGQVLFALCKPQVEERGLTDEKFWTAIDGDALDLAGKALVTELINFSRKDLRPMLAKVDAKTAALRQKVIATATAKLDDPKFEEELLAKAAQEINSSGISSGAAQESSASTPDPSPSDS